MTRQKIVLRGLHTPVEWQCAHNIVKEHAEPGKRIRITYGTPDGDLHLEVKPIGEHQWTVTNVTPGSSSRRKAK